MTMESEKVLGQLGRRSLFAGVGTAAVLGIASCGPGRPQEVAADNTLVRLRTTKSLKAAYILYPPFVTKDSNSGALSGLFIDLMTDISTYAKFDIKYVEGKWGTMVAGLAAGEFDLVVSGVFPTIPRAMVTDFASPLMYVGLSGVVNRDATKVSTVDDLRKPGLRIAVVNGEVGHEYAKRYLHDAELTTIDSADISRALEEVVAGRVDIALTESITCVLFSENNPAVRAIFTRPALQTFGVSVMLRQGDDQFRDFLNNAFDFLVSTGRLSELDRRYRKDRPLWSLRATPWA